MELDEEGTYARVMRQRRELIEPTLAEHHGKLINYAGDGFLAMFDSPVEAVRCAIVIQQSMVGRNTSLPRDQWILYRIGVHLGDVIVEPEASMAMASTLQRALRELRVPETSTSQAASMSRSKINWYVHTNRWAIAKSRTLPIQ